MANRIIAALLLCTLAAAGACTSSSSSSGISQGNAQYGENFRQPTTGAKDQYGTKEADKQEGDPAVTVMQLGLETGDVYPGDDYYAYAVVDNPTDRKNLSYVWTVTDGEIVEVAEAERGRLQTLVEDKYAAVTPDTAPTAPADGTAPAPLPDGTGVVPPTGPATPTITDPGAIPAPIMDGNRIDPTLPVDPRSTSSAAPTTGPVAPAEKPDGGAVKSEDKLITRAVYENRIVAGPEDEAYFSDDQQAEITDAALAGDTLDIVAAEQATDIRDMAQRTDDMREEPTGALNVVEADNAETSAPDTRERTGRKSLDELDAERGSDLRGDTTDYEADLADAEYESGALRTRERRDAPDKDTEIKAEDAYEKFTLITEEPFIRWTPSKPGTSKLFVKVRWKTDDLTKPTELPVEVRLREPRVNISDDEFPDMVREDEPLYIRIDGDNLPAFQKGLFTLSFDPDMLSFREAELGEFFDDLGGNAKLFYAQPDKLAGKVILAIDSETELTELSGGGPLLYIKFKAKRDIASRDETQLALVQDTSSQYVLDGAGDNVLPMAVDHPVYASALVMPPRYADVTSGVDRLATPGSLTPEQEAARAEAAKNAPVLSPEEAARAEAERTAAAGTVTPPTTDTALTGTGGTTVTPPKPDPILNPPAGGLNPAK